MNVGIHFLNTPSNMGGGHTFEWEILSSLFSIAQEYNHNFVIFSPEKIEKEIPATISKKIKIVVVPNSILIDDCARFFITNFFPTSPLLRRLYSKISSFESCARQNKIDIMVFLNPFHEPTDIPYITIVWDLQHRLQPWFPEVSVNGEWYGREANYATLLQRATYIISGTNAGQQEISLFYGIPHNRIRILPHPTPTFVLDNNRVKQDDIRTKYNIKNNYLLYPAQVWAHKNHVNALLALKMVKEQQKIPLSLVCVGSDKNNLSIIKKKTEELHLDDEVLFLGFVSSEDLIDLYQNAFALLYPSFFGPENLPPLEAFALRCPVIASNVSGSEEQLGDAALLVDPKNPEEIARAIISLYHDPTMRARLIERGYDRALQWTGRDFVRSIFLLLDDFESIRRCWE